MQTEPIYVGGYELNERNVVQSVHRVRMMGYLLPAAIDWLPQP